MIVTEAVNTGYTVQRGFLHFIPANLHLVAFGALFGREVRIFHNEGCGAAASFPTTKEIP